MRYRDATGARAGLGPRAEQSVTLRRCRAPSSPHLPLNDSSEVQASCGSARKRGISEPPSGEGQRVAATLPVEFNILRPKAKAYASAKNRRPTQEAKGRSQAPFRPNPGQKAGRPSQVASTRWLGVGAAAPRLRLPSQRLAWLAYSPCFCSLARSSSISISESRTLGLVESPRVPDTISRRIGHMSRLCLCVSHREMG